MANDFRKAWLIAFKRALELRCELENKCPDHGIGIGIDPELILWKEMEKCGIGRGGISPAEYKKLVDFVSERMR